MTAPEEIETADESPEPEMADEPFADAVADEEPFPTDEEFGEVAAPEPAEPDRSMTTPIDVAAVMAEHEPEVELSMTEEAEPPSKELFLSILLSLHEIQ